MQIENSFCNCITDKFIDKLPRIAKFADVHAKWLLITALAYGIILTIFMGSMLAVNPNVTFLTGYNFNQLMYVASISITVTFCLITSLALSIIGNRYQERLEMKS